MKRWLKQAFYFFGGIRFAIFLIAAAACFVIAGTVLEARYDSHLYAAQWTYNSPAFAILLALFFVNILFSACGRWPFKMRHIPFLTTHLGLLMVILGCLLKQWYGLQGHLFILEGSAVNEVIVPWTHALQIEARGNPKLRKNIPLQIDKGLTYTDAAFPGLSVRIGKTTPHAEERFQTWIKGGDAHIFGTPPLKVQDWRDSDVAINATPVAFPSNRNNTWDVSVIRTDDAQKAVNQVYLQNLSVEVGLRGGRTESLVLPATEALDQPLKFAEGKLHILSDLSLSLNGGFNAPSLLLNWTPYLCQKEETCRVDLQGSRALYPHGSNRGLTGLPALEIDLKRPRPHLLIVEDSTGDCNLFAFDKHGRVHMETFRPSSLRSLIAYDRGFGGYTVQAKIPFPDFPAGRKEKESADQYFLDQQIRQALTTSPSLSPPLKLLKVACDQAEVDFTSTLVDLLSLWHRTNSPLIPKHGALSTESMKAMRRIDWGLASCDALKALEWISLLCDRLEEPSRQGEDLFVFLKNNGWPFLDEREDSADQEGVDLLQSLSEKMLAVAPHLPAAKGDKPRTPGEQAHLLSAYFKSFGIDYRLLMNSPEKGDEDFTRLETYHESIATPHLKSPLILETPLTVSHVPDEPLYRPEDHSPGLWLHITQNSKRQMVSLGYDTTGAGLKWPVLDGTHLIRYEAQRLPIPYKIRLRQARQINFPDSNQPYAYEADVLVYENGKDPIEKTLSMNQVHETWDGYRFYLAGMSSLGSGLKRAQIVVNHDPAKYYLTYPGGIVISIGIFLLFCIWPYKK
jgi:hypothetical protein